MEVLKNVKFVLQVLHGRMNTLDRVSRKMPNLIEWCCILCKRDAEDHAHTLFVTLLMMCGLAPLLSMGLIWQDITVAEKMIWEFLIHPPSREKGFFFFFF